MAFYSCTITILKLGFKKTRDPCPVFLWGKIEGAMLTSCELLKGCSSDGLVVVLE